MLFSLCTNKQPHIISALYSLLSLNDESIQRQTLRIISNIYSKKSINDLTLHSDTINSNLDTIQALMPQEQDMNGSGSDHHRSSSSFLSVNTDLPIPVSSSPQEMEKDMKTPRSASPHSPSPHSKNENENGHSPTDTLVHHPSPSSFDDKVGHLSSPIKSAGSDPHHSSPTSNRNSCSSFPPLFHDHTTTTNPNNNDKESHSNNDHLSADSYLHSKVHDSNYKRNSLQSHLNLNALAPINNNVMMNINPDSLTFLYHIKYILRFIPIVNYCKDYGCTVEIKRKATTVLNKLKIIVKNYNGNIKKLNQL
ncbi:hypothetical protein PIROE2DRAFT_18532 [Piromyces sp. E2]|nr:hypothetical protein PIROE2DRAFT_18532 [Piromyces sp. E2]|eukprot:OUM56729.1 hypothetical protein PIROE2DRAFT_18532 [Piromyces sp. E2]